MAVRAQYSRGVVAGEQVPGYREEEGVDPNSRTETYAALRLHVSNWRWAGVPFYLRTGKRLARKVTEIAVTLKPVPHLAFQSQGSVGVQANQIILTVQPDEGVSVSLGAKIPGPTMRIRPVNMEFRYGTSFMSESPEAYERLILDAMRGDATLFTRNDEIEALWGIIDPILTAWAGGHERRRSPSTRRARRVRPRPMSCSSPARSGGVCDRDVLAGSPDARERPPARAGLSGLSPTPPRSGSSRRCAGCCGIVTPPNESLGARPRPEPCRRGRPRLEGRDRQPSGPGRVATTRPAPSSAPSRRPDQARRLGDDVLRRASRRAWA